MKKRRQILPVQPVSAQIEKFSHDGRGIARIEGKTTFIDGALANETVMFQYTKRKSDFDEGKLVSVTTAAKHRVEPRCPHYAICGGCSLQHLEANAQVQEKQTLLLEVLARIGHCQPQSILPALSSGHWHYRNKARLSVRYVEKKQATLVGFREKYQPRYIADIHTCPILHERVDTELNAMRHLIDSLDNPHCIAQIEVAAGDDEVALIFRNLNALSAEDEKKLCDFSDKTGFLIFLQPAGPDSVKLLYPNSRQDDYLTYRLPDLGIEYRFHPTDFTQVNAGINRKMVPLALDLLQLKDDDVVLDLFCGLGNFSLPLAKRCARVVAVEGSDAMVKRAQMNAQLNQIANLSCYCANLDEESALTDEMCMGVNKVLLDPPRTGALAIVKQIHKINPECIVYVSCNPITLARDADILVHQQGYEMISSGVMDMFPHTAHVESIAVFIRR